jgi:predicted PhzF superfamily epimerase YddE/YHI9
MRIWIVDAFAKKPFTGNPAAVVICKGGFPSDEICQKIATEMNLSETAFILPLKQNHFHLRWFTPKLEVKLCGHATLAAAHIIHQEGLLTGHEIHFDSLSGPLKVYVSSSAYTLDFPLLNAESKPSIHDDIIIEVSSEEEVRSYIPDLRELEKIDCRGIIITAKGESPYDFVSRFFAPRVGVNEDPVTGSAHCKLAHYWQQKLQKNEFLAYQASQRGGEIRLSIHGERVHLTGTAVTMLKGELFNGALADTVKS